MPLPPALDASLSLAVFDASGPLRWAMATLLSRVQFVLYLFIAIGLVLSTIHLATMFATRWGDRRVSGKSLLFSGGLHVLLMLALMPSIVRSSTAYAIAPRPIEEVVQVTTYAEVTGSEGSGSEGFEGGDPWTKLPEFNRQIERLEREFERDQAAISPRERPDRDLGPTPQNIPEAFLPSPQSDATPELARADVWPEQAPAAVPLELDTPQPLTRPELPAPTRRRTRSLTGVTAVPDDVPSPRPRLSTQASRSPRAIETAVDDILGPQPLTPSQAPDLAMATPATRDEDGLGPAPVRLPADSVGPLAAGEGQSTPERTSRPTRSRITPTRGRRDDGAVDAQPLARVNKTDGRRPRQSIPMARMPDTNRPPIEQPNLNAGGFDRRSITPSSSLPNPYRNRAIDDRLETAQKFGGNATTEEAVERALRFLKSAQERDGRWDASRYGAGQAAVTADDSERANTGREADTGVTGLCILAYLGAGNLPGRGPYADTVSTGIDFLIREQRADGYLGGSKTQTGDEQIAGAYCHAIATFALAETIAIQSADDAASVDPRLRQVVENALAYTYKAQLSDGGWRYFPRQPRGGDMSIFGWHLMSLKSARYAGIEIPAEVTEKAIEFLQERSVGPNRGLAAYRLSSSPTAPMTAEALFCRQMLGLPRDSASSREAVSYVLQAMPTPTNENFYYWYYGTLAMYQYGGDPWDEWNERVRSILLDRQQSDGRWKPDDAWGQYGGDLYSTALATLCLEVYYRYLPFYRQGDLQ